MAVVIVTEQNRPPRQPLPESTGAPPPPPAPLDGKLERVFKLIPVEVTTFYVAAAALISSSSEASAKHGLFVTLVLASIMVVLVIKKSGDAQVPPVPPRPEQYVFSVLALWTWALAVGNPLAGFDVSIPKWVVGLAMLAVPAFGGLLLQDKKK
jgi:hypothetical protein